VGSVIEDLRHALRALAARPGFALVIVSTLGLGLGANVAIFSAVHALLLRPFPFKNPDELVRISTMRGGEEGLLSVPEQDDLAALTDVIADIALYTDLGMYNASGFGAPEELPATIATANLWRVLGVDPIIGSMYPPETDRTRRFELVISHELWTRRFGQDRNIVGRTMTLDGAPGYTIHGVLPPGVNFPSRSDLFRSSGISADPKSYERRDLRARMAIARLGSGVTVQTARARIEALGARLGRDFPQTNAGLQFHVIPLRDLYVGDVRPYILLLFAAATLVMVVACTNVASLLLSQLLARDRELAVRLALGATRGRVVRQIIVESVVLAGCGAAAGLVLAWGGLNAITAAIETELPSWMTIELDGATLTFLIVLAMASGVTAAALPAWRASGSGMHDALKDSARGSSSGLRHRRLQHALIVAEVALAAVLLTGASLMVQSFDRLRRVDPGFHTNDLLTFRVELGWRAYDTTEKSNGFKDRAIERLRALPGVTAVALDSNLPLSGRPREPSEIRARGQSVDDERSNPYVNLHVVSADYFTTMDIPIEQGRTFTDLDAPAGQQVAIVSRRLAERLWPGHDPIGQSVTLGSGPGEPTVVVGVAGDIRQQTLSATDLDVYRPYRQSPAGGFWFAIRTPGLDLLTLTSAATRIVPELDPNQSFFDVKTMERRIGATIWQQQVSGALFALFAALALVLAVIGLYGLLSYLVTQQWRQIGVRLALGASPAQVRMRIVGRGVRLAGAGLAIGLAVSWASARLLQPVLFDVPPIDPPTFVAVPAALLVVAYLACLLPAQRATRIDPLTALRAE
jgi:putative ABC transport system permease protein